MYKLELGLQSQGVNDIRYTRLDGYHDTRHVDMYFEQFASANSVVNISPMSIQVFYFLFFLFNKKARKKQGVSNVYVVRIKYIVVFFLTSDNNAIVNCKFGRDNLFLIFAV